MSSNKLYQHRPQIAKNNFCVINVENSVTSARNSRQFVWMPLLRMGTQQWHHVHSPKVGRHPPLPPAAMAPSTPKLVVFLPPNHSTQQWQQLPQTWPSLPFPAAWHTTMAPCNGTSNGTTSTPPKLVATLPPNHSTLQWHLTVAPSTPPKLVVTLPSPHHSTLQWHPAMAPRPLPQSWSSPSPATIISTLQWHPAMAPRPLHQNWSSPSAPTIAHYNGTLQWHHDHSTKIGRHPPPPNHSTLQWHPAMAPRPLHQNWSPPSAPQP